MKQAILGATGNIGSLLLQEIAARKIDVKALARTLPKVSDRLPGVEYATADAGDQSSLIQVTTDISVLYVTLAIPYSTETWQKEWPIVMRNVIAAAQANHFKIVFLDNVYMYGQVTAPMTEDTPSKPSSKKGVVRAEIAAMLQTAIKDGGVTAVIGRSGDFYGPDTRISSRFFEGTYYDGVATWMGSTKVLRTFTYTLDIAKALAILGNDDRANQQIWHLPTAAALTGNEFIALAASILQKNLKTVPFPGDDPKTQHTLLSTMPEIAEMMYQYNNDYVLDSSKFQATFGMKPTPYKEGFAHVYAKLSNTSAA